jgi:hypothetical protein
MYIIFLINITTAVLNNFLFIVSMHLLYTYKTTDLVIPIMMNVESIYLKVMLFYKVAYYVFFVFMCVRIYLHVI